MPYFRTAKLLFIHVPKTGGRSLEEYFSKKYNITLDNDSLFTSFPLSKNDIIHVLQTKCTLQHLTYQDIMNYKSVLNIEMDNLKIISIVRNPYDRIISDLFYRKKINIYSTQKDVCSVIKKYLTETPQETDNHNIPQYLFLTDKNYKLIDVHIMRTETLNNDMHMLGYTDFDIKISGNINNVNYNDYLNKDSINLINDYYDYDFTLFNYKKM